MQIVFKTFSVRPPVCGRRPVVLLVAVAVAPLLLLLRWLLARLPRLLPAEDSLYGVASVDSRYKIREK